VVLRCGDDGRFAVVGTPDGVERLGGVDFDGVVFDEVRKALDGELDQVDDLDEPDEATAVALAQLRQACTAAKETLSREHAVEIPVQLPDIHTEVRLSRRDLEAAIRPALGRTTEALQRALQGAHVTPDQLDHVLVLGGSSRMPLVTELLRETLGRDVAVDAHPKHSVALGAAIVASEAPPRERLGGRATGHAVAVRPGSSADAGSPATADRAEAEASPPPPADGDDASYPTSHVRGLLDQRQKVRTRWTLVAAAIALAVAVGVTLTLTRSGGDDGTQPRRDLDPGDCYVGADPAAVTVVPCDESHDGVVVG